MAFLEDKKYKYQILVLSSVFGFLYFLRSPVQGKDAAKAAHGG